MALIHVNNYDSKCHIVAESTDSVVYSTRGGYDRVNCSIDNRTLSDCEKALIGRYVAAI